MPAAAKRVKRDDEANMTARPRPEQPVYVLTLLAARNDATTIRGLRAILKLAWRRYGFRCIDAREDPKSLRPPTARGGTAQQRSERR